MADFYSVFIQPRPDVSPEQLKKKMDMAVSWFRITPNVWILYTTSDATKWQSRLKPLVEPSGTLFICRLDVEDRRGWMKQSFWDWLKDKK